MPVGGSFAMIHYTHQFEFHGDGDGDEDDGLSVGLTATDLH